MMFDRLDMHSAQMSEVLQNSFGAGDDRSQGYGMAFGKCECLPNTQDSFHGKHSQHTEKGEEDAISDKLPFLVSRLTTDFALNPPCAC